MNFTLKLFRVIENLHNFVNRRIFRQTIVVEIKGIRTTADPIGSESVETIQC